ncbi:MAG: DNA topoisomerase, partial [Selenomonadaceae bacterium]
IIPTEQFVNMAAFTDRERKIYDLVVRRFIAVLYPPFEYEQTIVQAAIGTERFVAQGKIIKNSGWKEVYQKAWPADTSEGTEILREQVLPQLALEMELPILHLELTTGETKPPAPFNEGSLLAAMENPTQYMRADSKDLRQMIGETGGLGTVATRADIIEKLFSSFVIEKRGKDIFTTPKGRQLLELVPSELREPALTAKWEQKLSAIAAGKLGKNVFIGDIKTYTKALVQQIKNSTAKFRHDNITHKKCPECGRFLLEVNGKQGKMLVCQDRSCGYRKSVSRQTNARCPNCHKKMELRGDGENKAFFCKCGYREKLQAFQKRREQAGGKVSKNEVSKYLREQQSAEPVNTALADALAQLKLK